MNLSQLTLLVCPYPHSLKVLFSGPWNPEDTPAINHIFLCLRQADLNTTMDDEGSAFYGVSSQYESPENMIITCSTKVCSFGKQVVEKVEVGAHPVGVWQTGVICVLPSTGLLGAGSLREGLGRGVLCVPSTYHAFKEVHL